MCLCHLAWMAFFSFHGPNGVAAFAVLALLVRRITNVFVGMRRYHYIYDLCLIMIVPFFAPTRPLRRYYSFCKS